jgi:hypothetical protein
MITISIADLHLLAGDRPRGRRHLKLELIPGCGGLEGQ